MRAKIYSLRTQKMELDSRLLEMQSTIASLKDEQRNMEFALEEKQNEIKMLSEKELDSGKENPQVIALTETLKQKEDEIVDLKHRVEYPVNVWSVSTDDPSNPVVNLTASGRMPQKDQIEGESKEEGGRLLELTNDKHGDNSTKGGVIGSENESTNHIEDGGTAGEKSTDEGQGKKNELSQNGESFGVAEEKNNTNAIEATDGGKVWKSGDEATDIKSTDDKEHTMVGDGQRGKLKFSDDSVRQDFGKNSKGGMKLETSASSQNGAGSRVRGRHGYLSKTKGKRWKMIAKSRGLEHNGDSENVGAGSMRSRRFFKVEQESGRFNAPSEEKLDKSDEHEGQNINLKMRKKSSQEEGKPEISDKFKQGEGRKEDQDESEGKEEESASNMKQNERKGGENSEDNDNLRNKIENADTNQLLEKDHEMISTHGNLFKPHYSLSNIIGDAGKQKLVGEVRQPEDQEESGIQQNIESRGFNKVENNDEQAKVADEDEELKALEDADIQERETDAANGDAFRESRSKMEEDEEEYKEETDESEF
ncbi:hypothetical protein L1049_023393 [Liquidambar formosana]|uniref:Uncharacterized protein n=1 Tax=Liquidambar formosana TaxID=63359 RepID=A0AAP0RZD2_LIQFO